MHPPIIRMIACAIMSIGIATNAWCDNPRQALVFSRTTGFRHSSIPTATAAIEQLGTQYGFDVTATEDPGLFDPATLAEYDVVVFLHTTESAGNPLLSATQRAAFEQYIEGGGGFVGVHAASDVPDDWTWFNDMLGARFAQHPSQQDATVRVVDGGDLSTAHLEPDWSRFDEWYDFQQLSPNIQVLLELDESTYSGGMMGAFHPISWWQPVGMGRSWYTGMGHGDRSYTEPAFLTHLAGGVLWAAGASADYNGDSVVNLGDYTAWRDHLGDATEPSDYEVWKQFMRMPASRRTDPLLTVPEPAMVVGFAVVVAIGSCLTFVRLYGAR